MSDRTLDYAPRLDERNRAHRVATPQGYDPSQHWRYWIPGVTLDQGQEGSCVGHGVVGEYLASPVRGRFVRENRPGPYYAEVGHEEAIAVYNRAKELDEWEGVNYDGTSVRAGMLVGRERGWWTSFGWAFNLAELRAALETGPVVVGVEWREQMYEAPNGVVTVGGPVVGGHCLVVTGYTPRHPRLGVPAYRWKNSWGDDYGIRGSAYIAADDLATVVFGSGGEAAVAIGRAL